MGQWGECEWEVGRHIQHAYTHFRCILVCYLFSLHPLPVPSAPLDITRVNSSSSSIYISWKPPSTSNGVLISYTVTYTRLDTNVILDLTTLPDVTSVDLTMLLAFVIYRITVRAATSVGSGPDSEPLTVRTEQGGLCGSDII